MARTMRADELFPDLVDGGMAARIALRCGDAHLPTDPNFRGIFLIVVGRTPGNVWDVQHTVDGRIRRIQRKNPKIWVNHYAFHTWDAQWGPNDHSLLSAPTV
jgi:hypothetical protein